MKVDKRLIGLARDAKETSVFNPEEIKRIVGRYTVARCLEDKLPRLGLLTGVASSSATLFLYFSEIINSDTAETLLRYTFYSSLPSWVAGLYGLIWSWRYQSYIKRIEKTAKNQRDLREDRRPTYNLEKYNLDNLVRHS